MKLSYNKKLGFYVVDELPGLKFRNSDKTVTKEAFEQQLTQLLGAIESYKSVENNLTLLLLETLVNYKIMVQFCALDPAENIPVTENNSQPIAYELRIVNRKPFDLLHTVSSFIYQILRLHDSQLKSLTYSSFQDANQYALAKAEMSFSCIQKLKAILIEGNHKCGWTYNGGTEYNNFETYLADIKKPRAGSAGLSSFNEWVKKHLQFQVGQCEDKFLQTISTLINDPGFNLIVDEEKVNLLKNLNQQMKKTASLSFKDSMKSLFLGPSSLPAPKTFDAYAKDFNDFLNQVFSNEKYAAFKHYKTTCDQCLQAIQAAKKQINEIDVQAKKFMEQGHAKDQKSDLEIRTHMVQTKPGITPKNIRHGTTQENITGTNANQGNVTHGNANQGIVKTPLNHSNQVAASSPKAESPKTESKLHWETQFSSVFPSLSDSIGSAVEDTEFTNFDSVFPALGNEHSNVHERASLLSNVSGRDSSVSSNLVSSNADFSLFSSVSSDDARLDSDLSERFARLLASSPDTSNTPASERADEKGRVESANIAADNTAANRMAGLNFLENRSTMDFTTVLSSLTPKDPATKPTTTTDTTVTSTATAAPAKKVTTKVGIMKKILIEDAD